MKIRQGFVSNSSSSSFICEVSNPEEVAKSLDLIKSEILNEKKLTPYEMDILAKYISARIETYENIINAEEWEIKNLYDVGNFDVDAFYDCFKRDITIKEWLKEKWARLSLCRHLLKMCTDLLQFFKNFGIIFFNRFISVCLSVGIFEIGIFIHQTKLNKNCSQVLLDRMNSSPIICNIKM